MNSCRLKHTNWNRKKIFFGSFWLPRLRAEILDILNFNNSIRYLFKSSFKLQFKPQKHVQNGLRRRRVLENSISGLFFIYFRPSDKRMQQINVNNEPTIICCWDSNSHDLSKTSSPHYR